jgi:hypothetical protein
MSNILSLMRLPPPPPTPRHGRRHPHYHYTALLPEAPPPIPPAATTTTNHPPNPLFERDFAPTKLTTPLLTAIHSSSSPIGTESSSSCFSQPVLPPRPTPPCDLSLSVCQPPTPLSPSNSLSGVVVATTSLRGPPQPRTNPYFAPSSAASSPLSPLPSASPRELFGPFATAQKDFATTATAATLLHNSYVNLAASSDTDTVVTHQPAAFLPVGHGEAVETPSSSSSLLLPLMRSKTQPVLYRPSSAQSPPTAAVRENRAAAEAPPALSYHVNPFAATNPFLEPPPPPPLSFDSVDEPAAKQRSVDNIGSPTTTNPFRWPLSQIPALGPADHHVRQLGELFFARLRLQASRRRLSSPSSNPNSSSINNTSARIPCVTFAATNISDPLAAPPPPSQLPFAAAAAAATLPPIRKTSQVSVYRPRPRLTVACFVCDAWRFFFL